MYRLFTLGVDIGGTFTDLVAIDPERGEVRTGKIPSVSDEPAGAILACLHDLGLEGEELDRMIHGTTVATNALLERRGAVTAIVTTRGFRDVIEIGRCRRLVEGGMFNIQFRRPPPLVPRNLREEVDERLRANGNVEASPRPEEFTRVVENLKREGVEAVAVCFLHSYENPDHEKAVGQWLREQLGPEVYISLSSTVNPQYREFERFSTTVVNAYVGPAVGRYLSKLRDGDIGKLDNRSIYIMGSAGGVMDIDTAESFPVRTIFSGPAGGVTAGRFISGELEIENLITCDMGGTSADVALLLRDRILYAGDTVISGIPIRAAQIEIKTVGAGAGSIVWIDVDGALCVGPRSAGSSPGPACYGFGGVEPTITDANVILNRIGDGALLGGKIRVDASLARGAMAPVQNKLEFRSPEELAEGTLKILVARTVRVIREISLERGFDPREFAFVAFGGAGPMHATAIADELDIETVVVPIHPGNFSAMGLVMAKMRRDATATYLERSSSLDLADLRERLGGMAKGVEERLRADGVREESISLSCFLEMRCLGQAHEIPVPLGPSPDQVDLSAIDGAFRKIYAERYGRNPDPATEWEVISIQIIGEGEVQTYPTKTWRTRRGGGEGPREVRKVWFEGKWRDTSVFDRMEVGPGATVEGPAIIEESGATTVIPPGWRVTVHASGHLLLRRR